jgi:hypothetical protein
LDNQTKRRFEMEDFFFEKMLAAKNNEVDNFVRREKLFF